jgi:hypothetical protein
MKFMSLSIVLLLLCTGSLYALDKKDMVLYLPFDEGSGIKARDASGNGNDGELQGNVEWVDGQHGSAVYINDDAASNMVVVKDDNTLDITGDITIAMWINIETIGPDGSNSAITKADTYMIHTSNWGGRGIEQELLLWPFDVWQTAASTPIQLGEWRHVTGVYDGAEIKMYIDGDLMGQRARAGAIASTAVDLVIGRDSRACCNARICAQTIDEVMMFSRALSENEIKEAMKGGGGISVDPEGSLTATWGEAKATF